MNLKLILLAGALSSSLALAIPIPQPGQRTTPGLSSTQDFINNSIHKAVASREEDPLKFISKDMQNIAGDLAQYQTDKPVQVKQEKVVGELDILIQKLTKACKSGGGASLNPSRPKADSTIGQGPGGIRDLHDPKAGEKKWGDLPPKQREQILQSKTEGFPAGYEALLQSYYRRLAQEQVSGETAADAGAAIPAAAPTTAPSR
jgi:hypothetical protein